MEVRFQGLAVHAEAESAGRALPSIVNSYRNFLEACLRTVGLLRRQHRQLQVNFQVINLLQVEHKDVILHGTVLPNACTSSFKKLPSCGEFAGWCEGKTGACNDAAGVGWRQWSAEARSPDAAAGPSWLWENHAAQSAGWQARHQQEPAGQTLPCKPPTCSGLKLLLHGKLTSIVETGFVSRTA